MRSECTLSIITVTRNRAKTLDRLFCSLLNQTSKSFEWIVVDDASSDQSLQYLLRARSVADFPIILSSTNVRLGKVLGDNHAIQCVTGDLVVWCDSDDFLVSSAVEVITSNWMAEKTKKAPISVIVCPNALVPGQEVLGLDADSYSNFPSGFFSFRDLLFGSSVAPRYDRTVVIDATLLGAYQFPAVDYVIPESVLWRQFSDCLALALPKPLKYVEYGVAGSISCASKLQYSRGKAYAFFSMSSFLFRELSVFSRISLIHNFLRYSMVEGLRPCRLVRETLQAPFPLWAALFMLPISFIRAVHDRLSMNCECSEVAFLDAQKFACYLVLPHSLPERVSSD